uniref:Esterase/lipase/thioesterase family protein n=1 Tax=Solanum tuberosum TaxID=4113 RepID=M1D4N2_SOLTU
MGVEYHEVFIRNSRGVQLFTCRWLPFSSPKALVFLCHGYGMECSRFMRGTVINVSFFNLFFTFMANFSVEMFVFLVVLMFGWIIGFI